MTRFGGAGCADEIFRIENVVQVATERDTVLHGVEKAAVHDEGRGEIDVIGDICIPHIGIVAVDVEREVLQGS